MSNYEVWLHARDPRTMELIATLRVFTHPDRLAAETALENAAAMFDHDHTRMPFGSVVTTHMRGPSMHGSPIDQMLAQVNDRQSHVAHMFGDKR